MTIVPEVVTNVKAIPTNLTKIFHLEEKRMKKYLRIAQLILAVCLIMTVFSSCSFIKRLDGENEPSYTYSEAGGTIAFPEGFAPKGSKNTLETVMLESTLCGAFTQVPSSKTTEYFYPTTDSLTVTANGTTDGSLGQFRISLWKRTEAGTQWVETLYFKTNGETATGTFSGLDINSKYRISVAFSGATTSCTGSFNVGPLSNTPPAPGG